MGALRAWHEPNAAPEVSFIESRLHLARAYFVTVTGEEFTIRLTPDMADTLAEQLTNSARRARAAEA